MRGRNVDPTSGRRYIAEWASACMASFSALLGIGTYLPRCSILSLKIKSVC